MLSSECSFISLVTILCSYRDLATAQLVIDILQVAPRHPHHHLGVLIQGPLHQILEQVRYGCCSSIWWEWIQHGVPRGEVDERRQDLPDIRGHCSDPEGDHLQRVAGYCKTEAWIVIL